MVESKSRMRRFSQLILTAVLMMVIVTPSLSGDNFVVNCQTIEKRLLQDDEDERAIGGIVVAVSRQFFVDAKDIFLERLINKLQILDIKDVHHNLPLYLFNIDIKLSEFNIMDASYDKNDTTIKISKEKPNLEVDISNMSFNFELKYSLQTDLDLLNETGKFKVQVGDLSANLTGSPIMIKKRINDTQDIMKSHFEMDEIWLDSKEFNVSAEGGDIALYFNTVQDDLSQFVKDSIFTQFNRAMIESVENLIDFAIDIAPTIAGSKEYGFEVSYALVDKGIYVSDDYLSVVIDGHVDKLGQGNRNYGRDFGEGLPYFKNSAKDLQVFLSEYTLNTMLSAVIELQLIQMGEYFSSDFIQTIIEDFEDIFGDHEKVKIEVKPTLIGKLHPEYHPKVVLNKDMSVFTFMADVMIKNPFDSSVDAMLLECQFTADLDFRIGDDFTLYMESDNIDVNVIHIEPYFRTKVSKDKLNKGIKFMSPLFISYLNKVFDDGLKLPIRHSFTQCVSEPRIRAQDGYILVDGEPDFRNCDFRAFDQDVDFNDASGVLDGVVHWNTQRRLKAASDKEQSENQNTETSKMVNEREAAGKERKNQTDPNMIEFLQ